MASQQSPPFKVDRYVVIHVATTCDEHGVYVTKDSAEVIELGWILLDASTLDEVGLDKLLRTMQSTSCSNLHAIDRSGEYSGEAHQHAYYASVQ